MALGRGLSALISEQRARKEQDSNQDQSSRINNLPIAKLRASVYQPRQIFAQEALQDLAASIKEHGLLEPLIVAKAAEGKYDIICGERRLRAAKLAGLNEVPCLIREVIPQQAYALALTENIQREDLHPLEQAQALQQMMQECGLTQNEVAKLVGKSRAAVANLLRLNNLSPKIKQLMQEGKLELGHAKVLLALKNEDLREKAAELTVKRALSVRATEQLVAALQQEKPSKPKPAASAAVRELENLLKEKFAGSKVRMQMTDDDAGKITLSFASPEELQKILTVLGLKA